jgi:hypothetical protein
MKGVKIGTEGNAAERAEFIRNLFLNDCQERAKVGFIDRPLSAPLAQKAFRKRFGVGLNSQKLYQLRRDAFLEFGLDKNGRPEPGKLPGLSNLQARAGASIQVAARDPAAAIFNVAIVPTQDATQGVFLQQALEVLAGRGLVEKELRVDGIHGNYATVSRFPK